MAYNARLTERIRDALAAVPNVEEKRMFRGVTFMVNGKMCVSAGDEKIMCRVDPALHAPLTLKKGCQTVIMHGREYKGYVYVHTDALKTKRQLDFWIKLALDFNDRAKASRKRAVDKR